MCRTVAQSTGHWTKMDRLCASPLDMTEPTRVELIVDTPKRVIMEKRSSSGGRVPRSHILPWSHISMAASHNALIPPPAIMQGNRIRS